jgi:hypothetical protein
MFRPSAERLEVAVEEADASESFSVAIWSSFSIQRKRVVHRDARRGEAGALGSRRRGTSVFEESLPLNSSAWRAQASAQARQSPKFRPAGCPEPLPKSR